MLDRLRRWFSTESRDAELQKHLEELRHKTPVPVLWLFGKTQSGKTSIVRLLTGAETAEIGQGFKPCTRFSRQYQFPTEDAPILSFLDTRGLDEPGYDPAEDIARFAALAHVVLVVVKVMDHALENVVEPLRSIRQSKPDRPVVLVLTCLHEAYPQQQHPGPHEKMRWPGTTLAQGEEGVELPTELQSSIDGQLQRFAGLYDHLVAVDLTPKEEGFADPDYGGARLKQVLLEVLPAAHRQTLLTLEAVTGELQDLYERHALPHILGYSTMAATAAAIPIPWVDLPIIVGIQTRMIYHLAQMYGQPLTGERFLELAGTLGMGILVRQAARGVMKLVPFVGSVASAALAGAATFALGKAFCYYYSAVHKGHVPRAEDLKKYYQEQLTLAERAWKRKEEKSLKAEG